MKTNTTENKTMKKVYMIVVAVLVVAGMSSYALADSGCANGHRPDSRYQREQPYSQHDHRDFRNDRMRRDFRADRRDYYRPVVVHRGPIAPPAPVVRVYAPPVPAVSL